MLRQKYCTLKEIGLEPQQTLCAFPPNFYCTLKEIGLEPQRRGVT